MGTVRNGGMVKTVCEICGNTIVWTKLPTGWAEGWHQCHKLGPVIVQEQKNTRLNWDMQRQVITWVWGLAGLAMVLLFWLWILGQGWLGGDR
jgi:hypothetical protein